MRRTGTELPAATSSPAPTIRQRRHNGSCGGIACICPIRTLERYGPGYLRMRMSMSDTLAPMPSKESGIARIPFFPTRFAATRPSACYYDDFRRTPFADEMTLSVALEAMNSPPNRAGRRTPISWLSGFQPRMSLAIPTDQRVRRGSTRASGSTRSCRSCSRRSTKRRAWPTR